MYESDIQASEQRIDQHLVKFIAFLINIIAKHSLLWNISTNDLHSCPSDEQQN